METQNKKNIIDLQKIAQLLWSKKLTFLKVWIVTFILSVIWVIPQPRGYDCSVSLAPEIPGANINNGLSSIASSFGLDLSGAGVDALYPTLYPDLITSNNFMVELLGKQVTTIDGEISTDYYTYLVKHQKKNWLTWPFNKAKNVVKSWFKEQPKPSSGGDKGLNPFRLSEYDTQLITALKSNITCNVDKKTDVITIKVKDQDPLICATIADSVCQLLQEHIIAYRTSKARLDVEYYIRLVESSQKEYLQAMKRYNDFCEANQDIVLQSVLSEQSNLENEMQMKHNSYTAMCTQLEFSKAKLQERTPAFTILQGASVPVKPSSPKRMIFVAGMLIFATMVTAFWLARKQLIVCVN